MSDYVFFQISKRYFHAEQAQNLLFIAGADPG